MHTSRIQLLFLTLLAIVLLGAGCAKQSAIPEPEAGVIQEIPVPEDLGGAEKRAEKSGPPIEESETPSPLNSPWD